MACASGQRPQLSVLPEHFAGPADVFHRLCIADLDARAFQPDGFSRLRRNGGQPALLCNDGCHIGVPHRLEGILPEHALGYRHSFNELLPMLRGPVHLGEGRYEEQLPVRAFLRHRFQLGSDVAPERGVCLFINAGHLHGECPPGDGGHARLCLLRGDVARFRIDHQDFRFIGKAFKVCMGIGQHHRSGTGLRDLHSGVQRSRKVICQYQKCKHC